MALQPFLERLAEGPVVADGAMGTYLHELGYDIRQGTEELVLRSPDAVRRVHCAYIEAGAELIETNTFAANRFSLSAVGQHADVRALNAAAVRLAREAAADRAWVAGAIGPIVLALDDVRDAAATQAAYCEQAEGLCDGGVDALLLETFERLDDLVAALTAARQIAGESVPIIAQLVFAEGCAVSGETAEVAARRLLEAGAHVVGANCGRGLQAIRQAVEGLLRGVNGSGFVSAYPNAGYPEQIGGRTVYLATPAYIAEQAAAWTRRGVRLVGGCCGTTPETIRAIRHALSGLRKVPQVTVRVAGGLRTVTDSGATDLPQQAALGGFLRTVAGRRMPVIAEIDPPPHLDWQPTAEGARALLAAGADAVSLAENPLASIRMENFFLASLLRRETGGQVVCHMTCRDRNSLGLQSALLAAHASGVEAVLAVTGDPSQRGGHQRVVSVYEQSSTGLVRLIASLNAGRTSTGRDIKGRTDFSIGVAFNSAAANVAGEIAKLRRKRDEGAVFVMTQPVFDREQACRVLEQTRLHGLRVFLGFLPPITVKLAHYLHNEVPGIRLAEPLLRALSKFSQPEDQERAAIDWTANLITSLAVDLEGVYLITPGARWRALLPLLDAVQGCG